jgi:AraC-like DNA-binding protein
MDSLIIIIAIIHAYVFAVLFFLKRQQTKTLLGIYMLSFFIQANLLANFYIYEFESINIYFYLFIAALSTLDVPIIYLYIKKLVDRDFKWNIKNLIHLFPSAILLISQLVLFLLLDTETKLLLYKPREEIAFIPELQTFFSIYKISIIVLFLQIFSYSGLMIYHLVKHKKNIEQHYSYKHKISLNWLFVFVILYILYSVFEIIIFAFNLTDVTEQLYFSIISLHIFFVGIWCLRQRDIYQKTDTPKGNETPVYQSIIDEIKESEKIVEETIIVEKEYPTEKTKKITRVTSEKRSWLSEDLKNKISSEIERIMHEKKLFLNPELSLDDLAEALDYHKNYVSHTINDVYNINFYNLINKYRIDEAKQMLSNPKLHHLSIEGVAKSAGYKSRNVFYPIFKRFVGSTPIEYKNKAIEQISKNNSKN